MSACILCNNSPCQCQELIHKRCNDEISDLRAKLQTAEKQIADTQKEFGRIQGTSAKQVVDRFLDLMRKLNEKDLPAGFESWEAYGKYIDGIKQRAISAEQEVGRLRGLRDDLLIHCERLATDLEQACRQWNMYAEEREDEDLEKESHAEAASYRAAVKTAKDWRDKAFTIMHPGLALQSSGGVKGRKDGELQELLAAVRNLRDQKGRHNTGIAYDRLMALPIVSASSIGKEGA